MEKSTKKYRFFYHYRKQTGGMSVHFRGQCIPTTDVICNVPCETKRNRIQPRLVLRGYCNNVEIDGDTVIIN